MKSQLFLACGIAFCLVLVGAVVLSSTTAQISAASFKPSTIADILSPAIAASPHSPTGTWNSMTPMPTARGRAAVVELGGKVYVIGGTGTSGGLSSVEIYDPVQDQWTIGASMPTTKTYASAVIYNQSIYVFGSDTLVYAYDPQADHWSTKAPIPQPPADEHGIGIVNNEIYISYNNLWTYLYSPATDMWTARTPITLERSISSFARYDAKLYAIGGGEPGHVPAEITRVDRYDPSTDTWYTGAILDMPVKRTHMGRTTPVIGEKMYVIGGWDGMGGISEVDVFDFLSNTWSADLPMPTARWHAGYAVVKDTIYVIGGENSEGWLNTNEALKVPLPQYTNVAEYTSVAGCGEGQTAAWADYDRDDDLDIYVTAVNGANCFYRNNGDGSFIDIAVEAGVNITGTSNGVVFGDIDNDNDLDLFVTHEVSDTFLFLNQGNGLFTDVSATAGITETPILGAPLLADYNADGYLDLYLTVWGCDILYQNNGDGSFTNVSAEAGIENCAASVGGGWADYDNDGDLDIYIANFWNAPNVLFKNMGDGTFTETASLAGVDNAANGQGVAWGDYDNDSYLDLYVANDSSQPNILYHNNGDGTFTNATSEAGVGDTHNDRNPIFADFDNDGDLDLLVTVLDAPNLLYQNNGNGAFTEVASSWGLYDMGSSHGAAAGDFNNDGFLDIYVVNQGALHRLFRNNGNENHWLVINLIGSAGSNKDAVGARVQISYPGHQQIREVQAGTGWLSSDSLPVEFGLGDYEGVITIKITWPGNITQAFNYATQNMFYTLRQGVEWRYIYLPVLLR